MKKTIILLICILALTTACNPKELSGKAYSTFGYEANSLSYEQRLELDLITELEKTNEYCIKEQSENQIDIYCYPNNQEKYLGSIEINKGINDIKDSFEQKILTYTKVEQGDLIAYTFENNIEIHQYQNKEDKYFQNSNELTPIQFDEKWNFLIKQLAKQLIQNQK